MGRKGDIEIGRRAFEELVDTFGGVANVTKKTGLRKTTIYGWNDGSATPGGRALQAMALCGIDVIYVLTGRRATLRSEREEKLM